MNWNQIPRIPQRDGYGQGLLDLCAARPDVVVLDADVAASTRTNWVRDRFPDHFYNLGISEQDLVGTAAGLALGGQLPYVSTYGVFLSGRAFDQIRTTVCYNNLKVRFGGAHAGISVGPDGATHQALEDLALARVLPHMTVIAPCDSEQTRKAVLAAVDWPGPVYFRRHGERGLRYRRDHRRDHPLYHRQGPPGPEGPGLRGAGLRGHGL